MGWLLLLALGVFAASKVGKRPNVNIGDHAFVRGDSIYLGDPSVWPAIGEQAKGKNAPAYGVGTIFTADPNKLPLTQANRAFVKTVVFEIVGFRYAVSIGMYRFRLRFTINGAVSPIEAGYSELIITQGLNLGAFKRAS
jgi:hypothetical protein